MYILRDASQSRVHVSEFESVLYRSVRVDDNDDSAVFSLFILKRILLLSHRLRGSSFAVCNNSAKKVTFSSRFFLLFQKRSRRNREKTGRCSASTPSQELLTQSELGLPQYRENATRDVVDFFRINITRSQLRNINVM